LNAVEQPDSKKLKTRAHCSHCKDERNCDVEAKIEQRGGDEDFQWHTDWYILKCCGCDAIFFQTVASNSEEYHHFYNEDGSTGTTYNETIAYWPPVLKRAPPSWLMEYAIATNPKSVALDTTLEEVYGALNNDLPVLAAIGIRTSFDVAAVQLGVVASKTFAAKLNDLVGLGKIREADRKRLESLIDAGNASAHRGWKPNQKQLELLTDILESFIEESFVIPKRKERLDAEAAKLTSNVPQRPQRN
jgi:hypothetical protein